MLQKPGQEKKKSQSKNKSVALTGEQVCQGQSPRSPAICYIRISESDAPSAPSHAWYRAAPSSTSHLKRAEQETGPWISLLPTHKGQTPASELQGCCSFWGWILWLRSSPCIVGKSNKKQQELAALGTLFWKLLWLSLGTVEVLISLKTTPPPCLVTIRSLTTYFQNCINMLFKWGDTSGQQSFRWKVLEKHKLLRLI